MSNACNSIFECTKYRCIGKECSYYITKNVLPREVEMYKGLGLDNPIQVICASSWSLICMPFIVVAIAFTILCPPIGIPILISTIIITYFIRKLGKYND